MVFLKFILFLVYLLLWQTCSSAYVYPMIWGNAEEKLEKISRDSTDNDVTLTEFIFTNFLLPMKDVFCNVYTSFMEVYNCLMDNFMGRYGQKNLEESKSYFKSITSLFYYKATNSRTPRSCSYYSILVVATSVAIFLSFVYVAKKLVEYMMEENTKEFLEMSGDNCCPCYDER